MTDPVSRPTFYEGEVLPAADLIALGDSPRNQLARQDRYLHSWGIAAGFDLSGKPTANASGTAYKIVTVTAGVAIDGTGREVVVPDDFQLTPSDFQGEVNPLPDPKVWYPFFLVGLDQPGTTSSNLTGACNSSQPTTIQETYNVVYGNPGDELNLDQQQGAANVSDGPGDGVTTTPWRVLLGFVQWSSDPTVPQFTYVTDLNPVTGIERRYVGVNAAEVISGSGTLLLATHPAGFSGNDPIMAVEIQEKDGSLIYGKLNPNGEVNAVLTVSANGNLTTTGQISGAVTPGSMQVQSGIAFDGMTLPLPIGINPADVDAGKITIHTHLTLRMDQSQFTPPSSTLTVPFPYECRVDPDTRQIHCRIQWCNPAGPLGTGPLTPAFCDYTVIAAVPAASGSTT